MRGPVQPTSEVTHGARFAPMGPAGFLVGSAAGIALIVYAWSSLPDASAARSALSAAGVFIAFVHLCYFAAAVRRARRART